MTIAIAQIIAALFEGYAIAGLGFAFLFLPRGIARLDHRVDGSPGILRLLILPGVAAFWPLFAWRWFTGGAEPVERNPHRAKAGLR